MPGLASGESITRQFAVTATETITNHDYRVAASNGFSATGSIPVVTIVQVPVSGLAAANDSPTILGHVSSLTATTTAGSDITYTWAFGDGQVGSGAVVTHTYPATGVYTAVVTASNLVSSLTATTPVTIVDAAIAGLEATNDSPTSWGQLTTLSATITTGANVAYVWNFGDGQLGSGKVVTHTYADAGVYTAIVTASNSVSTITATTNVTIVQPIFTSYLPIVLKPEG